MPRLPIFIRPLSYDLELTPNLTTLAVKGIIKLIFQVKGIIKLIFLVKAIIIQFFHVIHVHISLYFCEVFHGFWKIEEFLNILIIY